MALITLQIGPRPKLSSHDQEHSRNVSPNQALQRAAGHINCSAAGDLEKSAHERWRARVLMGHRAVAELSS